MTSDGIIPTAFDRLIQEYWNPEISGFIPPSRLKQLQQEIVAEIKKQRDLEVNDDNGNFVKAISLKRLLGTESEAGK